MFRIRHLGGRGWVKGFVFLFSCWCFGLSFFLSSLALAQCIYKEAMTLWCTQLVLSLFSFNVNGLNGPVKRKRVLTQLKKLQTDIAFLQETHLTTQEHKKLRREWVGHVLSFNSKAREVAILTNKNIPVTIGETIIDPAGRYVLVNCQSTRNSGHCWTYLHPTMMMNPLFKIYLWKYRGDNKTNL